MLSRLRREIRDLRQRAGGRSILLADGTLFRYSREETARELFIHTLDHLQSEINGDPRKPPPPVMEAVARARDRHAAVSQLYPSWETDSPCTAFDLQALVERGELRYLPLPAEAREAG